MDKASKDLSFLYENKIMNEGVATTAGDLMYKAYQKITGKKLQGVTGIMNRWSAAKAVIRQYEKFIDYSSIKNELDAMFAHAASKKFKTTMAKEQYIEQYVQSLAPKFQQLGIPWSEIIQAQQAGKMTDNLMKRLAAPVNNILNEIALKTELPPAAITNIFWEPSAAAAENALKQQMPLISNMGKSARFWLVWVGISTAMVHISGILLTGANVIIAWLEVAERAGKAAIYAADKVAQASDKVGEFVDKLEALFNGVPYTPDQDNDASPPPSGEESNKSNQSNQNTQPSSDDLNFGGTNMGMD